MHSSTAQPDTAVILAAGRGTRLQGTFSELPKGFLPIDGVPIVERSIRKLMARGISRVVIGTGHLSEAYERLAAKYDAIECVRNEAYAATGSMRTLYGLREYISGDFLLLESDLIYEERALRVLLEETRADVILASGRTGSGDEVFVQTDAHGNLANASKDPQRLASIRGEWVGISRLSSATLRALCAVAEGQAKLDYEQALVHVAAARPICVRTVEDLVWAEIDDAAHLHRVTAEIAPRIFTRDAA